MPRLEHRTRRLRGWALRGLSVCYLIASGAIAQEPQMTSGDRCTESNSAKDPEAARVAFRAGQTAFSEGGYERAFELWNQAYGDDCTAHALLLNLAMAQELLGRPEDAIQTLTLFNRRSPGSPYVDANVKRIEHLQLAAAEKARARSHRESAPVERPASADGISLSLPWVVGVTGTAVAVVGTVLFVEGRSSASAADENCGSSRQACTAIEPVVDGERARTRAQVGGWMAGAGLVTAAGGLVWHLLSGTQRPLDQPSTLPRLSLTADGASQSAGLEWNERF
jgi:tetratricopeptide (TPR) repeat protein